MRFCDLQLEDSVPDNTVLSRFRTELTEKGVFDLIFQQVNVHLEQKGVILKKDVMDKFGVFLVTICSSGQNWC